VTISFIVPTKGRETLSNLVTQLLDEIGPDDEVLIIGDGLKPPEHTADARFRYFETAPTGHWGNEQRQFGMERATKDFLFFADDDDGLVPGAISAVVRPALDLAPGRPHIFRLGHEGTEPARQGMIDARGCFVPPNVQGKLGRWDVVGPRGHHCQGWIFIRDTLAHFPRPVYHPEEVYMLRPYDD
jgi:glycosyltransferase involved in cell wall biosynthesis